MNPFSTCFVRPGALAYQFPPGESAERLVVKLAEQGWRGQIVGPHGSGKSTLMAALMPRIEQSGRKVLCCVLHDRQRTLPLNSEQRDALSPAAVLAIDGFEQLSVWSRWRIGRLCRRRGCGLLATAHADIGLPELFRTETTAQLARRLVEVLAPHDETISADDVESAFAAHRGDMREAIFGLYDLYEQRRPR